MNVDFPTSRPSRRATWLAALFLAVHALAALVSLRQQSVTFNEFAHLPAGISYWHKGTFFMYSVNPPLVKLLAALPVLAARPKMTYGETFRPLPGWRPEWEFGVDFMRANRERYLDLFFLGRYPMVALSVLGGWYAYRWSRQLYGDAAGVCAAALWAFCPNMLAAALFITPDIGAASMALMASYAYWRWLARPSWTQAAAMGLVLGLGQLTKFTLLVLYPIWIGLWLVWFVPARPRPKGTRAGPPTDSPDPIAGHGETVVSRRAAARREARERLPYLGGRIDGTPRQAEL